MNERIKELAFGANFLGKKHNGADFRWGYIDPELEKKLEKFAELIVRKCIDLSIDTPLDSYGEPKTPEACIGLYFGVEE